jgi:8-oxo-dGTP pyrophosphatase MutT (NUDIX family)
VRETQEEVGLDISGASCLGQLDDVPGSTESVLVSGFVYGIGDHPTLVPNHEVQHAFWMPVSALLDPARHIRRDFGYLDRELLLPAIRVLDDEAPVLWGITYRFLELFFTRVGLALPEMPWHDDL